MTDPVMADHVYLLPLTTKSIVQILKEHPQIDAVLTYHGWANSFKFGYRGRRKRYLGVILVWRSLV